MRLRKAGLRSRVNGDLALRFEASGLTSFAGLELVRRYFRTLDLPARMRRSFSGQLPTSDFGAASLVLLLLGLLISGGRRVGHVEYLKGDPLVLRLCGLKRLPTARTISRWLGRFTRRQVARLSRLNDELVTSSIRASGVRRLTVDVDGSVVSTGLKVGWAQRGFNPHRRKVKSYYPITAYEAQTGQFLKVKNRPGNVHDGKASVGFLRSLIDQLRTDLGRGHLLEFRMDGAFFRQDVLTLLEAKGAEYAIKVPFLWWLELKELIRDRRRWKRVDGSVSCFEQQLDIEKWGLTLRVVIYRKKVRHESRKNYQLDLFDPSDGHYEYSAVTTNKTLGGRALWHFMCGRGTHEKAYSELKSGFGFDSVPSLKYGANSAWQALSVIAFNLMRGFQSATVAEQRRTNRKRRSLFRFETIHTLRFRCLNRAGILIEPNGRPTLDVGTVPEVRRRFEELSANLLQAASLLSDWG